MKVSNNAVLIHFSRQTYDDNYSPTDTGHFKLNNIVNIYLSELSTGQNM